MAEEIDPIVLQATKDSLGKYIKKPPLSDKLLGKPPFKFLHDIFSVVIKEHGLMEGLFTPAEMKSDTFKDKESKVAYIQKVIDVMEFVTGDKLHIKPGKVVAGLETAKTNALLQSIGKALETKPPIPSRQGYKPSRRVTAGPRAKPLSSAYETVSGNVISPKEYSL